MSRDPYHMHQPDAVIGNNLIELKSGMNSVRELQSALLRLAQTIAGDLSKRGLLVLVDPRITQDRLRYEEQKVFQILRPELVDHLSIVVAREGKYSGLLEEFGPEDRARLDAMVHRETKRDRASLRQGESYYEILKILIHQWLCRGGPMKISWIVDRTGYSYPSVATALDRLSSYIVRHSDRSVELARFPEEEWARLMANSDIARSTMRFKDMSSQPMSPDLLLKRVQKIQRSDIGVGGVFGARHYYPDLDLVGSPRLDVSIHAADGRADVSFVERLDPALKEIKNRRDPAQLAIHFIRRRDSFFQNGPDGMIWADPVECLLDLYEVHLESQARAFLQNYSSDREGSA